MREASYSSFLREPKSVIPLLSEGDVRLARRDDEDLVITGYARFEAREWGTSLSGRLLMGVSESNPAMLEEMLTKELPWLAWLSDEDQASAVNEIGKDLLAGLSTGALEALVHSLRAWQETAEIESDPKLAKRLRGPFQGDGAVLTRPARGE